MKLKVFGCSGSKLPGHELTSFLINRHILLDAGSVAGALEIEDQAKITDVLITHAHLDHTKDILFLADNLIEFVAQEKHEPLKIRGAEQVLESISRYLLNDVIWPDFTVLPHENPVLAFEPLAPGEPQGLGDLSVIAFPVKHATCAFGYVIYGQNPAEHVAVTGDTGHDGGWTEFINNMPFPITNLIVETSFPNELEDIAKVSRHMTPKLLRKKLDKLKIKPKLYITHIKAVFAARIQEQLQTELAGYTYHLLRKGDLLDF